MMWGSLGLGLSMMMISILLSFSNTSAGKQTSAASVAFFFTYMLIFGASVNCIPWVYVPEILPLHVRAKGSAIGISANALWNFFVVMVTPTITSSLPWQWPLIFVALNFAFIPLVFFCYPETTRLTLEEMDLLFVRGDAGLRPGKKKAGRTTAVVRSLDRDGSWRKRAGSITKTDMKDEKSFAGAAHIENV